MKCNPFLFILFVLLLNACAILPAAGSPATALPPTVTATSTTLPPTAPATNTAIPSATATPEIVSGAIAREYIAAITETIGARVSGSQKEAEAAQYNEGIFKSLGYSPEMQPFTATGYIGDTKTTITSTNVIAVKPGDSAKEIIVGAHYDSVDDGLGADDNASGVAVMLEVAERIKDLPTPYTIRFIAFGAEEAGFLGSYAYVEQMSEADIQNTIAMINLDSLIAGDFTYLYSGEDKPALRDWALSWAQQNGLDLQTIKNVDLTDEEGGGCSDYAAFQEAGIPFGYFEATNWNLGDLDGYTQVDRKYGDHGYIWHTPFDNLQYIDSTFPGRVDAHLSLFVQVLNAILTRFTFPQ